MLMLLVACGPPLPSFDGIDLEGWKKDKKGCAGKRAAVINQLRDQRMKLQGLSEVQIVELLGRPDENELAKRNQKFYNYLLEPGAACGGSGEVKVLSIRFNATGAAKEIAVN